MLPKGKTRITLAEMYLAYRKAKVEAFYENTHFHAISFTEYEQKLERNLRRLMTRLSSNDLSWTRDLAFIGNFAYTPKSVAAGKHDDNGDLFYRCLDPIEDWRRQWGKSKGPKADAEFRLVIVATVDFQITAALWILKVGHKLEAVLNPFTSVGNRLRRRRTGAKSSLHELSVGELNVDCAGLFAPYFSAYRDWRGRGLEVMRSSLPQGASILAITMDLKRFYHSVSPEFLLRKSFLNTIGVELDTAEIEFTRAILDAVRTWYESTPDYLEREEGALPVGLSISKIISNVLLYELDNEMVRSLSPLYYGRYVDDIFLVLKSTTGLDSGSAVTRYIATQLQRIMKEEKSRNGQSTSLRLSLKYAKDSDLVFSGAKQKVFNLQGLHGLDLVAQIEEQIRKQSSEHRLLSMIPASSEDMASRALLAQTDASLDPDALRKADVLSVRRLGFSLLMRDVECYARDLSPKTWKHRRREFYGLVQRHVLTPEGFFQYFGYMHRALGVMIACGDYDDAVTLVLRLEEIVLILERTTTRTTKKKLEWDLCRQHYAKAFVQVIVQATTVLGFRWDKKIIDVLRAVDRIHENSDRPRGMAGVVAKSKKLLYSDWGRRPYRDHWLGGAPRNLKNPPVPAQLEIRRLLRLGTVRAFRKAACLQVPYWPGLAFPTRPMGLSDITTHCPSLIEHPSRLRSVLFAFRGARAKEMDGVSAVRGDAPYENDIRVAHDVRPEYKVAVPSYLTKESEWIAAANNKPELTLSRYERLRRLLNRILIDSPRIDYIVMPECSVPLLWARGIATTLASRGISFIAGIEYRITKLGVRNDAFLSLTTRWPWYAASVFLLQPKCAPSHDEKNALWQLGHKRLYKPTELEIIPPLYVHGAFCFGLLICSDLTTIAHRSGFQGRVDALFVLEWNKDLDSFAPLVEATASDLHCFVIQSNNRLYGDSRVRVPAKEHYDRDRVRVRGGMNDYFVVTRLNVGDLRSFQINKKTFPNLFKPIPIGYQMSELRKS